MLVGNYVLQKLIRAFYFHHACKKVLTPFPCFHIIHATLACRQAVYVDIHTRLRGVSPRPYLQKLFAVLHNFANSKKQLRTFLLSVPLLKSIFEMLFCKFGAVHIVKL